MFIFPALNERIVFSVLDGFARAAGRGAAPPRMDSRSWALLMVANNNDVSLQIFWSLYFRMRRDVLLR